MSVIFRRCGVSSFLFNKTKHSDMSACFFLHIKTCMLWQGLCRDLNDSGA